MRVLNFALSASAIALACAAQAAPTLIENVQGYTFAGKEIKQFSALAFENGRVLETGQSKALLKKYAKAERIDGQNKTLLPGLIDVHGHVFRIGFRQSEIILHNTQTLKDAQEAIRAYAQNNPNRQWLIGNGWNQVIWKLGRFPTAAELDAAVSDRPVTLRRVDAHATWANTLAMKQAGITKDTKDPEGGKIERDENGNPTGIFIDKAAQLLIKVMPPYSDEERKGALNTAMNHFASLGLTNVGDAGTNADEGRIYKEFADEGKLITRIYAMISDVGTDNYNALSVNGPIKGYAQDVFTMQAVKIYTDGALGSRGAALLEPYSDDEHNKGLLFMDDQTIQHKFKTALQAGFQVNVHAIGDAANRQTFNAFAAAYKQVGDQKARALRNRIEHAQVVAVSDLPRFNELNLIASMQPTHATSDMNMAEARIGKDRMKGAYAWKTLLNQKTLIAGGSDFPVESANPFFGLHAAVTRSDHEGKPVNGWYPQEAMTLKQAFRAFTLDAAYAQHQEKSLGSLEKGKWADFILIDQNLFKIPAQDIWKIKVDQTWLAGKPVYTRQ